MLCFPSSREVPAGRFETTVVVPGARFTRYEAGAAPRPRPPVGAGYVRAANNAAVSPATTPGPPAGLTRVPPRGGPRVPGQRYAEYYDNAEYPERRYRYVVWFGDAGHAQSRLVAETHVQLTSMPHLSQYYY